MAYRLVLASSSVVPWRSPPRLTFALVIMAAAATPSPGGEVTSRTALAPGSTVIRDVTVISMRSGTYTSPTLTIPKFAFALGQKDEEIRARPEWVLMPPKTRDLFLRANERYWKTAASEPRRRRYVAIRDRLVKEIRGAGGRIMAGSDARSGSSGTATRCTANSRVWSRRA